MQKIRDVRVKKLLSQASLAREANVAPSTIYRLEKGLPVEEDTFKAVCVVLEISPEEVEGVNLFFPVRDRRPRSQNG